MERVIHPWTFTYRTGEIQATMQAGHRYFVTFLVNNLNKPAGVVASTDTTAQTSNVVASQPEGYNDMNALGYDLNCVVGSATTISFRPLGDDVDTAVNVYGFLTFEQDIESCNADTIEEAYRLKRVPTMKKVVLTRDRGARMTFNFTRGGYPLYHKQPILAAKSAGLDLWASYGADVDPIVCLNLYFTCPVGPLNASLNFPDVEFKTDIRFNTVWGRNTAALDPDAVTAANDLADAQD